MADNEHRQPMRIAPESARAVNAEPEGDVASPQCCCKASVRCCYFCGPKIPRWACCTMCLMLTYLVAAPILFLAMHFVAFPGNVVGDYHITGASEAKFAAVGSDGRLLDSLALPVPSSDPSGSHVQQAPIIFFGGNAEGMSGAVRDATMLLSTLHKVNRSWNFKVHSFAQRGYSPNQGWTSQGSVISDTSDFLDYVLNSTDAALSHGGRVIIGGWSMGSGVALQLAAARPERVAGVVVFCPWRSLRFETLRIAAPLTWLLWPWIWLVEPWDSQAAIASLPADIPVAVLSAENDQVISPGQHRAIFEASNSLQKWWLPASGATHPMLGYMVVQGKKGLAQWTKAVWDRIDVFEVVDLNTSTRDSDIVAADDQAFDIFEQPLEGIAHMLT